MVNDAVLPQFSLHSFYSVKDFRNRIMKRIWSIILSGLAYRGVS